MIELPRWDATPGDTARCLGQIDAWTSALRGHDVVAEFSPAAAHKMGDLVGAELADALDAFAGRCWDFRQGMERNLAIRPVFSRQQEELLDRAASALGLMGTPPPRRQNYDAIVMTGGMVRAGIVKPRFARELFDRGVSWNEAVFLGGFREFAGDEVKLAPILGVAGTNEFDAMVAGMRFAFDLDAPNGIESSAGLGADRAAEAIGNSGWRIDAWRWNGRKLQVVAAPSSNPEIRRANTADTYRFWAERTEGPKSVLVVTTPVYVPYQGAAAIEVLGIERGFSVETVAVSDSASDLGEHSQEFLSQHKAQELRSAIHGMRSLRSRLVGLRASG